MITSVTKDSFTQFVHTLSHQLLTKEKVLVELIDEKDLYINSEEYLNWKTWDEVDMKTFIADLKQKYEDPQA